MTGVSSSSSSDSGIQAVGDIPYGTHFCQFYRDKQDLADVLVPYFVAGLRNNEYCMWVTSEPFGVEEAKTLMREAMPDFPDRLARGQIEIWDYMDWYLANGGRPAQVLQGWIDREKRALDKGYAGLRLTGNTFWLEPSVWDEFVAYESEVNRAFGQHRIIGLCTYCLDRCRAEDVLDVCRNHQFALTRREGEWELIESSSLKIAKDELARLNHDLERRVTERTQALEEALKGRDEFLAMLGHELRNPLAPIRNATEVIRLAGPADSSARWARDVIDRQVGQFSRLVDDLLDVSRVTRGRIELHKEEVDLASVLSYAVETSRPFIDRRRHTLTTTLPSEPVYLHADQVRLSQVMSNLLNNAAKYMEEGGHIQLTAERQGDTAVLRVRDEGIGIPPEMLPRVFDLFTQLHSTLDRSEGGLGIGLALVRSLVEQHGGTVEARSAGNGRGSEFVVTLPVLAARQLPLPGLPDTTPDHAAGGRRILVVDDNLDVAESMGLYLEMAGHEVRLAHDGESVLPVVERYRPEVILLDIGLPGLDGYEVARRLRLDPGNDGVLLVAVTGYGREQDRDRGRMAGFDHYLVKPVDPDALRALLASARQLVV